MEKRWCLHLKLYIFYTLFNIAFFQFQFYWKGSCSWLLDVYVCYVKSSRTWGHNLYCFAQTTTHFLALVSLKIFLQVSFSQKNEKEGSISYKKKLKNLSRDTVPRFVHYVKAHRGYNFKFPARRLSQIMRDFGSHVICHIWLKIILPSLNLFLGADKIISVVKLRKKWFLAKMHSFIGVCKISYIKHVLSTKKSPLQLSASS